MKVSRSEKGKFYVLSGQEIMAGPFDTNSEAWRQLDRMTGAAVSKAEDTAEWVWNNTCGVAA